MLELVDLVGSVGGCIPQEGLDDSKHTRVDGGGDRTLQYNLKRLGVGCGGLNFETELQDTIFQQFDGGLDGAELHLPCLDDGNALEHKRERFFSFKERLDLAVVFGKIT